ACQNSKSSESLDKILENRINDPLQEEDGLGIPLVVLTLQGLKIPLKNFKVLFNKESTIARVDFPLSIFHGGQNKKILLDNNKNIVKNALWQLYENLEYSMIVFHSNGEIKNVSGFLPAQLGLADKNIHLLPGLIRANFFEDIFIGPFNVQNVKKFENYRLNISSVESNMDYLFNISGYSGAKGDVVTLWQKVNMETREHKLSEGSLFENIQIQKLLVPYIPKILLDKARETIHKGLKSLPTEGREVTLLFADVIGFTGRSQSLPHNELINLLNLIMGIVVHSIEKNSGYIDKFLGDGVMSIFLEPLSAVVAAIEIQNNLFQLNEFRAVSGADPLNMRIGINSGQVILGSVGTKKRMDWTALGDVVNTASRIEKLSRENAVLIGDATYSKVRDLVTVQEELKTHIRGKSELESRLYFIDSVFTVKNDKNITIALFK
ncbi:MAG: adenylate/guanylate cyclase domain-containing protein, partial [Spirochaetia bacterium]|nr:adenylate/guanylate cyclase domain-containing protein [Spirochaetia bacterium]